MATQASAEHQKLQQGLPKQEASWTRIAKSMPEGSDLRDKNSRAAPAPEDWCIASCAPLHGSQYSRIKTASSTVTYLRSH